MEVDLSARLLEEEQEQSSGGSSVNVIIAEDDDLLPGPDGSGNSADRLFHVLHDQGVGKVGESRGKEASHLVRRTDPAVEKHSRHKRRNFQLLDGELPFKAVDRENFPLFPDPICQAILSLRFASRYFNQNQNNGVTPLLSIEYLRDFPD